MDPMNNSLFGIAVLFTPALSPQFEKFHALNARSFNSQVFQRTDFESVEGAPWTSKMKLERSCELTVPEKKTSEKSSRFQQQKNDGRISSKGKDRTVFCSHCVVIFLGSVS